MADLNELLQRCDKNALVGAVKSICDALEYYQEYQTDEVDRKKVKNIIHGALFKMKVAEKRQRDKDQNAFTVVLGAGVVAGKQNFQFAEAGGRERTPTGLLAVGGDVLSFTSTFLSWEKVKLLREWKSPRQRPHYAVQRHDWRVQSCHISPCSSMIVTSSGPSLHLWDAVSGLLKNTFEGHTDTVVSCRFCPDGKNIVSGSDDKTLKVWDVASGSLVRTLVGHTHEVACVDVAPDNAHILSTSKYDETWKLWNSRTGELQHNEQMYPSFCNSCSFSPGGSLFLVGCDNDLRLYDSTTYQLLRTFIGHGDPIRSCSFAPDGATILSGSVDTKMKLWSTTTGQCLRTLDGHSRYVQSCSFSPSGHEIYSVSGDNTIAMWTAATGQLEGIVDSPEQEVHWTLSTVTPVSICASPDGKSIVGGYHDGTVKMWCVK
jgi:WD40 repeat protein